MQKHEKLFQDYLAKRGLKLTTPRRQILDAVFSLHEHFDAEQLYDYVKNITGRASLATIYRTLPLLVDAGLIQLSLHHSSRDVFEHIYGHRRHVHWICSRCGAVQETSLSHLNSVLRREAAKLGFATQEISVQVKGVCSRCRSSNKENQ
ncbi:MAG: Fur family transcriptional regulator [Candidatus Syntrophosphaera sp.]